MGASLLIFLNKTDVEGCMDETEVREVSFALFVLKVLMIGFALALSADTDARVYSGFAWIPS